VNDKRDIITELLYMAVVNGTRIGEDLYKMLSAALERYKPSWHELIRATTDASPNFAGRNTGLLKGIQVAMNERPLDRKILFSSCIIHQKLLRKTVTNMRDLRLSRR
jgi:hypothetical protein